MPIDKTTNINEQIEPVRDNTLSLISPIGSALAVISFFMPWLGIDILGFSRTVSGIDLSNVDSSFWLFPLMGIVSITAYFICKSQKNLSIARPIIIVSSGFALFLLLYKANKFFSGIELFGQQITVGDVGIKAQFGLFGAICGFILALVGCFFINRKVETKETSTNTALSWENSLIGAFVGFALIVIINSTLSSSGFFGVGIDDYQGRIVVFIAINVILATSLNLINGFTGQFSIGHAGFMAVGAYSSAYFTVNYGAAIEKAISSEPGGIISSSVVLLIAIVIGAVVAAIAGLIVGIPSLRLKGDYLAIVTLGFAEIIRIVILNIDAVGGATGYTVPGYANFLWVGIFAVLTIVVVHNIVKSDAGRALVSIREDELAAEAMGVNTTRYKVTAFVISSAFAGIAGVLFAHYNKFLSTNDFQFIRSFEIIIMIVLGGLGSMSGAIIGAVVVTILPELLRKLAFIQVPFIQVGPGGDVMLASIPLDSLRLVIFALILILTMILRPQGIFGTKEFGLSWLKRPRKVPAGTETVGDSEGTPIAQQEEAKRLESEEKD